MEVQADDLDFVFARDVLQIPSHVLESAAGKQVVDGSVFEVGKQTANPS